MHLFLELHIWKEFELLWSHWMFYTGGSKRWGSVVFITRCAVYPKWQKKGSKGPVGFGEINSDLVTGAEEPREQLDWHKLEMSEAVCRASWPSPPKDALNQCKSRTLLDPLSSPHLTLLPCFLGNPDVCCWCFTDASSTVSSSDSLCSSRQGADLSSVSGPAYQQDVATTGTGTGKHGFRSFWKLEEVSRCLLIQ